MKFTKDYTPVSDREASPGHTYAIQQLKNAIRYLEENKPRLAKDCIRRASQDIPDQPLESDAGEPEEPFGT